MCQLTLAGMVTYSRASPHPKRGRGSPLEENLLPNLEVLDEAEACALEARAKLMHFAHDFADVWVAWGYQWGGVALVANRPSWDDGARPEVGWEPLVEEPAPTG
jgi:hypothetical protein